MSRFDLYDDKTGGCCVFCDSVDSLMNLYHPKNLSIDERGSKYTCCRSCYVYIKSINADNKPFEYIQSKLKSRRRNNPSSDYRWHLGLSTYVDDCGAIGCVEDSEGFRFDPLDVQKYFDHRSWLVRQSVDQVEKWCNDNLTDQRFINKVVSSFSS